MFHDEVELWLESGKGGDGSMSYRREKYIPRGGPDGGDGGRGGDVYIQAQNLTHGLNHLASVRQLKAENGTPGMGKKMFGHKGDDLIVTVPIGTKIYRNFHDRWKLVADLTQEEMRHVLTGGPGGLGNVHYATATNQTPRYAQPGEPSQRAMFKFELSLIADVGIIGMPNSGKSTFLSIVSQAKPKIADYPFTTLSPVLGVVQIHDRSLIFADIPGLIEGAAEGKGLGHTFLKHIRRTQLLLHFIDSLSDDYKRDYMTIRNELATFDPSLTKKPELVVLTKAELITADQLEAHKQKVKALKTVVNSTSQLFSGTSISAVTQESVKKLLEEIVSMIEVNK